MSEAFKQDLKGNKGPMPGGPFLMQLLFKEPPAMPDQAVMTAVLEKHVGAVNCYSRDDKMAGFEALEYMAEFKEGKAPVQLMVMACNEFTGKGIDAFVKSQMWDCPDRERVLAEAFFFQNCGKLLLAQEVRDCPIEGLDRFIRFGVNARFFNVEGTGDMVVDTVGMSTLYLPDLQYHFHDMDPNWVVNHAYNVASYILENDCPIQSGETVDGVENGAISRNVQWKCQLEESLIQPPRPVLDVHMGQFAAGGR